MGYGRILFVYKYFRVAAIFYALRSLYVDETDMHIEIQSDNITAIKYVNDKGGMTCKIMDQLAKDIWEWCVGKNIFITAIHIPGIENTAADFYSRNFSDTSEWMLKKEIFQRICFQFFMPTIDMFASRLNKQMEKFVSWFPEPGAYFVNAFNMSWNESEPFLFPPFNQIGKVINKVRP